MIDRERAEDDAAQPAANVPSPEAPLMLFKIVLKDGRAPHQNAYVWSLPTRQADGTWMPGAWHEESTEDARACVKGLHIASEPLYWRSQYHEPIDTYLVEVEGLVGDPVLDTKVIAARVRLLRLATDEEVFAASKRWQSFARVRNEAARLEYERRQRELEEERIRREREEQRERMAEIREAGRKRKAEIKVMRDAGVLSTALLFMRMTRDAIHGLSDTRRGHAYIRALRYAVEWLQFEADDIHRISVEVDPLSEEVLERIYVDAIDAKNESAIRSIEHALGRRSWWYGSRWGRRRLCMGAEFDHGGKRWKVTSFRDEDGYLNATEVVERKSLHNETFFYRGVEWIVTKFDRAKGALRVTPAQKTPRGVKAVRFTRKDFNQPKKEPRP